MGLYHLMRLAFFKKTRQTSVIPASNFPEVGTKISKQMVKTTDRAAALMPAGMTWQRLPEARDDAVADHLFTDLFFIRSKHLGLFEHIGFHHVLPYQIDW